MAIISENKNPLPGSYFGSQLRYAMTYVVVTFCVLLILNVYCSKAAQRLFYESKQTFMLEQCELASDKIASLEVINPATVRNAVDQMDSLKVSRMLVTDQGGTVLYDSVRGNVGKFAMLPEVLRAVEGNDVFSWQYHDGAMYSRAAAPIVFYDNVIGCVYMAETDTAQGMLIKGIQHTVLQITMILEVAVILFSLVYARSFAKRMQKIMDSMRIIRNGDYSYKVSLGGKDELTLLADEINDLTERLQTSEQKRSRFVSDASHELKTPLASIKLLSDSILQNDMDLETTREFVGDIGNEADRLNRMTEKLLSLTRVDGRAAADTDCEIILVGPTIRRVVRMLKPVAGKAEITIHADLETDCPVLILEDDLYQIVFNLMENGIKYNQPGGHLYVSVERSQDNCILTIRDTGVGIPEDGLQHIFERFYRVDKARSRATGGSGLGLAIVKTIVLRNRGEITVESTLGQGTTFHVAFPIFDTEDGDA